MSRIDTDRARAAARLDQDSAAIRDLVRSMPDAEFYSLRVVLDDPDLLLSATWEVRERVCVLALNTVLRACVD